MRLHWHSIIRDRFAGRISVYRPLLVVGLVWWLLVRPAYADVGPKPSMLFRFDYQVPKVAIAAGQQMECDDPTCDTGKPLKELGPQRFSCDANECRSMAYGYADYHRLVIAFSDGVTRESNVFATQGRGGDFVVTVTQAALEVKSEEPAAGLLRRLRQALGCIPGGALTLVIETLVAGLCVSALGLPRALLGAVPVANLFTLPMVWFVFPQLTLPWVVGVGLSELFAVVFEAGFVYAFTHWTLSLRRVAILSLVMNGASFAVGLVITLPGCHR
jgi:hypothetical protein